MAGRRICAGYYRRYDGKTVYVISLATDTDSGEEAVVWTTYPFADVPKYYISSKKSFCAFIEANGERKAKYKRLLNMNSATTLNTYFHVTDKMRQRAAVKIDQGIAKVEVKPQEEKPKARTMTTYQARKRWTRKAG